MDVGVFVPLGNGNATSEILRAVAETGYTTPTPIQAKARTKKPRPATVIVSVSPASTRRSTSLT